MANNDCADSGDLPLLAPWESKASVDVVAAGLREFYKDRDFESDGDVVARIYAAMRQAEQTPK
jgi:hypothetical protein